MTDLEQKRKRIETGVKIAAVLGVGLVAAPFIFLAIKGLVGLIIASAITITTYHFTPWAGMKLANWRLAAIKAEANTNPILTLQNEYNSKMQHLGSFGDTIKGFSANVNSYEAEVAEFSKLYPDRAPKYKEQLDKMRELLNLRKRKYKEAKESLHAFDLKIQELSAEWNMSQSALKLAKQAGMSEDDFFSKIKTEAAFDSVQNSTNMAFADLEFALMDEQDAKKELATSKNLVTDTISPIPARQQIPTS